jgi:hypothetical protein
MAQPYNFGLIECVGATLAGVSHYDLHTSVEAMIRSADALAPLCRRLGIKVPPPHIYGLGYVHVSTLGVQVINGPEMMEPGTVPCIHSPEQIDSLREPDDYLVCPLVASRLALVEELRRRRPDAGDRIGHDYEGPITTAVLMMGPDFFMLPYDDPKRAHRLLEFITRSSIHYTRVLAKRQGRAVGGEVGNPDDFAGMFPPDLFAEFVAPYWDMLYDGLGATSRSLHSELLREEHMPFLEQLKIATFDPAVDPHLPVETLARSCRVPYGVRIWPATVIEKSADELIAIYRHYASFHTRYISFEMSRLEDEEKIARLLAVARELA